MQSASNLNNNTANADESNAQQNSADAAGVSAATNAISSEKKPFNENLCKVFIGNIPRSATEEQLREFFDQKSVQFKEMSLMKDPVNNANNRGFGFFSLASEEETDALLLKELEQFQGKNLDIKRAAPKDVDDPLIQTKTDRVFVGGLPQVYTVEEITELFNEKYSNLGKVVEVIPKKDKITGKSRGFCFIVFENFHVVDKIMIENRFPYLNNKRLEVRKADPLFPIQGGPPSDGAGQGGMRRSGGPIQAGKMQRMGGDRNQRMNQNPYRNGNNPMRQNPRRQSPYVNNQSMQGGHYPRQGYGYTNRPPPAAYADHSQPMSMPPAAYGSSHAPEIPQYGGNAAYVPYGGGASSQQPPIGQSYPGAAGNQYNVNPYGAVNYGVSQGGNYQQTQMGNYPSGSSTAPSNPPSGQNHPGGY